MAAHDLHNRCEAMRASVSRIERPMRLPEAASLMLLTHRRLPLTAAKAVL